MKRESFVFYESWMDAIQAIPTEELRNEAISAIIMYGLGRTTEEDWKSLNPFVQAILMLIKPMLDKNQNKWENAKKGGRPKKSDGQESEEKNQNETKTKPNENQNETNENQNETNENQNDVEVLKVENQAHINNVNVNVNDNVNVNSLSASRARANGEILTPGERERCLEILIFEKKVKRPGKELEKFENFYQSRGWKDAQGRQIADRVALLRSWEPKNATSFKAEEVMIWKAIVDVLRENGLFSPVLITDFFSAELAELKEGKICHIRGSKYLGGYLHRVMTDNVYNCVKTAISGANIAFHEVVKLN